MVKPVSVGTSVTGGMGTVGGRTSVGIAGTDAPGSAAASVPLAAVDPSRSSVVTIPTIAPAVSVARATATRAAHTHGGEPGRSSCPSTGGIQARLGAAALVRSAEVGAQIE